MIKNQQEILDKLQITSLNPMQEAAREAINGDGDVVILSPTGTGKTLAFLLPILAGLNKDSEEIQVLIIVPTRELALQIELVLRDIGTGHKVNAIYGGRAGAKDKEDLQHLPSILIGTPGRIADHMNRGSFKSRNINTLILDEYDKSLEIGFEPEMKEILASLPGLGKKILTSATQQVNIPTFVGMTNPLILNYLGDGVPKLRIEKFTSSERNRFKAMIELLAKIGDQPGILFCNQKDTLDEVMQWLGGSGIPFGPFHGGMEQRDRERSLIKFRNGTHRLLVATDLAARGIDVSALKFILHFDLPQREQEFVHRNGRTARMQNDGTAYILATPGGRLSQYLENVEVYPFAEVTNTAHPKWSTLFVSAGRKDKVSKGDIAGTFIKKAGLAKDDIGIIEVKQDCAFVAVAQSKVKNVVDSLNNTHIKKRKIRISEV
ncbi:MAG: superfamily II DNA/RNA helicase [Cyclobacteriaceae bacterium]|jgi:superfamily II DNA/RNA helicase